MPNTFDPEMVFWFQCFYIDLGVDENGHPIKERLWHFRHTSKKLLATLNEPNPLLDPGSPERKQKVQEYREFYELNAKNYLSPFREIEPW